jgi:hypothetical protein
MKRYKHKNWWYAEEIDDDMYDIYTSKWQVIMTEANWITVSSEILEWMWFEVTRGVVQDVMDEIREKVCYWRMNKYIFENIRPILQEYLEKNDKKEKNLWKQLEDNNQECNHNNDSGWEYSKCIYCWYCKKGADRC